MCYSRVTVLWVPWDLTLNIWSSFQSCNRLSARFFKVRALGSTLIYRSDNVDKSETKSNLQAFQLLPVLTSMREYLRALHHKNIVLPCWSMPVVSLWREFVRCTGLLSGCQEPSRSARVASQEEPAAALRRRPSSYRWDIIMLHVRYILYGSVPVLRFSFVSFACDYSWSRQNRMPDVNVLGSERGQFNKHRRNDISRVRFCVIRKT